MNIEAITDKAADIATRYDAMKVLREAANDGGFSDFMIAAPVRPTHSKLSEIVCLSSWAPDLMEAYDAGGFLASSKAAAAMASTTLPFWLDLRQTDAQREKGSSRASAALFLEYGMPCHLCFLIGDGGGSRHVVSFSGEASEPDAKSKAELHAVAVQVVEHLRLSAPPEASCSRPTLTPRQVEIMEWVAAGKTTPEIGTILDIAPNTVDGHIAAACDRLGSVNRAQAVATLVREGVVG